MTSQPPSLPRAYAGIGVRALAHLIDSALWMTLMMLLVVGLFWDEIIASVRESLAAASGGTVLLTTSFKPPLWFTMVFNYAIPITVLIWLWKWKSATPGKMLLGLKVADESSGGALSMRQCVLRMLGYVPPMVPLTLLSLAPASPRPMWMLGAGLLTMPLLWGFISIARDERKRGWHDKLAGTVVLSTK